MNRPAKFVLYDRFNNTVSQNEIFRQFSFYEKLLIRLRQVYDKNSAKHKEIIELQCDISQVSYLINELSMCLHHLIINQYGPFDTSYDALIASKKVSVLFNTLLSSISTIKNNVYEHMYLTPPPMFAELQTIIKNVQEDYHKLQLPFELKL